MVALAKSAVSADGEDRPAVSAVISATCARLRLAGTFDAVIALFHVVSYQTTEHDLRATFATAARHLNPGGVLLFDVWHGPAVLAQQPEQPNEESRRRSH